MKYAYLTKSFHNFDNRLYASIHFHKKWLEAEKTRLKRKIKRTFQKSYVDMIFDVKKETIIWKRRSLLRL